MQDVFSYSEGMQNKKNQPKEQVNFWYAVQNQLGVFIQIHPELLVVYAGSLQKLELECFSRVLGFGRRGVLRSKQSHPPSAYKQDMKDATSTLQSS